MLSEKLDTNKLKKSEKEHTPETTPYGTRYFKKSIPKFELPQEGMPSRAAYLLIQDELNLDGNPRLNLASFVTTWMEPEADQLIMESLDKNYVDTDEYPQTLKIQERVVNMFSRLFNVPDGCEAVGTATIGSSEAIMLGLLAHKWSWREKRKVEGKSYAKPNLVMGADVHTVWEKFALYFDVELKLIPLKEDGYTITPEDVAREVDEHTIAVGAVVGTTFTGQMDPVKKINDKLVEIKNTHGWDIPLHVDGASGGFVLPFLYPEIEWDFRLEQVRSINVSGHKYGLVYPGIGWLLFKDKSDLPDELVFNITYLGGNMANYSLNFSKGSSTIIAQYYNFIRLGFKGYKSIMENLSENANYLARELEKTGQFEVINEEMLFPLVTVKLLNDDFTVYQLSDKLRENGWIIPAYNLPENAQDVQVLRMVIKENFSRDMIENLLLDINAACNHFVNEEKKEEKQNLSLLY